MTRGPAGDCAYSRIHRGRLLLAPALALSLLFLPVTGHTDAEADASLSAIAHSADDDNSGAQLLLGLGYLEGRYALTPDPAKAVYWLRRSARNGQPYAQRTLGNLYWIGKGVTRDRRKAAYWWRRAAEAGDAEAQRRLGEAYQQGAGVAPDAKLAVEWLRAAARQGDREARYLLGRMYLDGQGVPADAALARDWLSQAAAQGHSDAIRLLSLIASVGRQSMATHEQSAEVLLRKAQENDPQAQYELALRYESGVWDVLHDDRKALYWLERAAENGNRNAMRTLVQVYDQGELGTGRNVAEADRWRRVLAEPATTPAPHPGTTGVTGN